jgi:hypothetical protein
MIDILLKIVLFFILIAIFYQDTKDRLVLWFLYPIVGIMSYFIQASAIGYILALVNSLINLAFTTLILLVLFVYSRFKLKTDFVNGSMGLGDILLFIALSFTFSSVAFLILLVFSLLFSLVMHAIFKNRSQHGNVPLAGYISLFFAAIYLMSLFIGPKYLFA